MNARRLGRWSLFTLTAVLGSALGAACSGDSTSESSSSSESNGPGGPGAGQGGNDAGAGQGGAAVVTVVAGPGVGGGEQGALAIAPQGPSLDVEYGVAGQTVQFTATRNGGAANGVAWFLSTPEAGTISADGLFTSNGLAGGQITVGARLDDETATTTLTLNLHVVENPSGITPGEQETLTNPAPGLTDAGWTLWYPYADTVFPRGVPAPAWQSATGAQMPSVYYVKMTGANISYEGFLPPEPDPNSGTPTQRARPSRAAWDAIGTATDGGDLTVEISKLVNGQKVGPITQTVRVARGKLKGTIYYNTYGSLLAGSAAVMRIKGDLSTPEVLLNNCRVCHSVAADGSTVATADHSGGGGTFDLLANPDAPPNVWTDAEGGAFAGLYPFGGEVLVTHGLPGAGNTPGSGGTHESTLRMRDGTIIPNSGIEALYAQTPVFSHDGTKLAFYDRPSSGASGALAVMDFDMATKTFSNHRVLATPENGRHFAWPAFTPDGKFVFFQDGTGGDLMTWGGNMGRLRAVDVETAELKELPNLNSDAFLPQGVRDQELNFEPSLLPIASGGYYWVMFTSRRTHGNTLLSDRNQTKRLWVAALKLDPAPGEDASFPPFYVEGQEQSGNSRGFWALDPCAQDGTSCESGDQCCNGFCNPSADDPNVFVCGQPDGSCSDEFESCETAADCCDSTMDCINGRCAQDDPNIPN